MKKHSPDPHPVLVALMKGEGEQPQERDQSHEDPGLVAADELAQAIRRGDPAAIRDAFETMLEAVTSADDHDDRDGYSLGGAVRPRLPRLPRFK